MKKLLTTSVLALAIAGQPVLANQAQNNALSFIIGAVIGNNIRPRPRPEQERPEYTSPQPRYCTFRDFVPKSKLWVAAHYNNNGSTEEGYWIIKTGHYRSYKAQC